LEFGHSKKYNKKTSAHLLGNEMSTRGKHKKDGSFCVCRYSMSTGMDMAYRRTEGREYGVGIRA